MTSAIVSLKASLGGGGEGGAKSKSKSNCNEFFFELQIYSDVLVVS